LLTFRTRERGGRLTGARRVFERLLDGVDNNDAAKAKFLGSLRRDGYVLDETTGHLRPIGPRLSDIALRDLDDPSAIREHLDAPMPIERTGLRARANRSAQQSSDGGRRCSSHSHHGFALFHALQGNSLDGMEFG